MSEKETGTILVLVVVAFLVLLPILSMRFWSWKIPWRGMMGIAGYGLGFMFIVPLLLFILIVIGSYLYFGSTKESRVPFPPKEGRAIEILNERYAKGEITREEYTRMKEELRK